MVVCSSICHVYALAELSCLGANFIVNTDTAKLYAVQEFLAEKQMANEGVDYVTMFPNFEYLILIALRELEREITKREIGKEEPELPEWARIAISPGGIFDDDETTNGTCHYMNQLFIPHQGPGPQENAVSLLKWLRERPNNGEDKAILMVARSWI